jgi:hypothetical protein
MCIGTGAAGFWIVISGFCSLISDTDAYKIFSLSPCPPRLRVKNPFLKPEA